MSSPERWIREAMEEDKRQMMTIRVLMTDGRDEVYNDVVKTVQLPDSYTLKIYNSNMHFDIDTNEVLFMQSWVS